MTNLVTPDIAVKVLVVVVAIDIVREKFMNYDSLERPAAVWKFHAVAPVRTGGACVGVYAVALRITYKTRIL